MNICIYIYIHVRAHSYFCACWGFPKLGVPVGVPMIRFVVFPGLYWGPPIAANYHVGYELEHSMRLSVW